MARVLVTTLALAALLFACSTNDTATPTTTSVGPTTTTEPASLPVVFADPIDGLSNDELERFIAGSGFFEETWTSVGPTETATDGLGPLFNADSCAVCHPSTGRRKVPPQGPLVDPGLVIRISLLGEDPVTGAPVPEPVYGDQLQDRANSGAQPEGTAYTDYVVQQGQYRDGTIFEILWPTVNIRDRNYGSLTEGFRVSARIGAQMIGMGVLESIPEADILALADPSDADGDGVSGRPNIVWDPVAGEPALGRFGWKANVATLEQQIAQAFHGDLGVTSSIIPFENCSPVQTECETTASGGTAEVSDERLDGIAFYLRSLAVPEPRAQNEAARRGEVAFDEFGCATCHVAEFGGAYTDLLLHDLGFDMADDRADFAANGNEWRTAPLWGLGLVPAEGDRGLLHDGRARTIEEAILWHGGEGSRSRASFIAADAGRRSDLIAFLETL